MPQHPSLLIKLTAIYRLTLSVNFPVSHRRTQAEALGEQEYTVVWKATCTLSGRRLLAASYLPPFHKGIRSKGVTCPKGSALVRFYATISCRRLQALRIDSVRDSNSLSLSQATKDGRLQDFISQEESHGVGPVDKKSVMDAIAETIKTRQLEDQTSRSACGDGSGGQ